jgi:hypothetical protein
MKLPLTLLIITLAVAGRGQPLTLNDPGFIALLRPASPTEPETWQDGLVAWYTLESHGADSVNRYNLWSSSTPGFDTGIITNGLVGDGTNYFLRTNSIPIAYSSTNDWSVAFWFQLNTLDALSTYHEFILIDDGNFGSPALSVWHDNLAFRCGILGPIQFHSDGIAHLGYTNDWATNTWYLGVATLDTTNDVMTLHIGDGTGVYSYAVTNEFSEAGNASGTPVLTVGSRYRGSPGPGDYTMDELGIWNRVLTATEVAQVYNAGTGRTVPLPPPIFALDFEGTGAPTGVIATSGSPDYDYATSPAPLVGSQSLKVSSAYAEATLGGTLTEVWFYFVYHQVSSSAFLTAFTLRGGAADQCRMQTKTGPAATRWTHGAVQLDSTGTNPWDTTFHVWVHYKAESSAGAADGLLEVWRNTTREFSGASKIINIPNGGGDAVSSVRIYCNTTNVFIYDDVMADDAVIGDNPFNI